MGLGQLEMQSRLQHMATERSKGGPPQANTIPASYLSTYITLNLDLDTHGLVPDEIFVGRCKYEEYRRHLGSGLGLSR